MAARCPVYDMGGLDRDAPRLLLRRRVYRVIGLEITEILGDRRRQRRLAMVHMPNRPDVDMRLRPLELLLRHWSFPVEMRGQAGRRHCRPRAGGGSDMTESEAAQAPRSEGALASMRMRMIAWSG